MSGIQVSGQKGEMQLATGVGAQPFRQGHLSELIVSELHGRFYEQILNGRVYSIGCSLTALSAATILLTASAQPIVGVWNPPTSGVNVSILQAMLIAALNNVTSVAPGMYAWAGSIGNVSLTSGLAPYNRKTMANNGSACKAFALSTASLLAGLTNNLTIFEPAEFNTASALLTTTVAAATPTPSVSGVQNFDGSMIVPPGGVLALVNTISSTTHSVAGRLMWEENPIN